MKYFLLPLLSFFFTISYGQHQWQVGTNQQSITCSINESVLPFDDNIEMAGRKISGIISYAIDTARHLSLSRKIIFPQLPKFIGEDESKWQKYRAYLQAEYNDDFLPTVYVNNKEFAIGALKDILIDGTLDFKFEASSSDIEVTRTIFPSTTDRLFCEKWELTNTGDSIAKIDIGKTRTEFEDFGIYGSYKRVLSTTGPSKEILGPGESLTFSFNIAGYKNDEPELRIDADLELEKREKLIAEFNRNLILETPQTELNTLFAFSKIRAAENIFDSKMGIVHSPGGGRYYAGVWANDQAEYSGPFFPYLGYTDGNKAALNAYEMFYGQMKDLPNFESNLMASFEMNAELTCCGTDRGDAAMIAYGGAHYLLALGDETIAREYFPMVEWGLEFSHRNLNKEGVVMSESDEMEGRIPTGDANLSTSSLYYGALLHAADLAKALNMPDAQINKYKDRAANLRIAIEKYFGATQEGLETYRYYEGHKFLRHWICLPLVVGIDERKEGTVDALFERLWTDNGVHVEKNSDNEAISKIFWDRGTLYALRGTFVAGETKRSLEKLTQFSNKRLLGDHVPYVVEAYPEGNMAHLSAESALYCRVFTEGMFGMNPIGFNSFTLAPKLPEGWNEMALRRVAAFNQIFDVEIKRLKFNMLEVKVISGKNVITRKMEQGGRIEIILNKM